MRIQRAPLRYLLDPNGAFLREIGVAVEEVFRGLGFVVRDANWGTPALAATPTTEEREAALVVDSGGSLDTGSGDLAWKVTWTLSEDARAAAFRPPAAT